MPDSNPDYAREAVVSTAEYIDKVLWTGLTLAVVSLLGKLFGLDKLPFLGGSLSVPFDYNWVLFLLLTIAHIYSTAMFVRFLRRIWIAGDEAKCKDIFDQVTSKGGIFMRGMVSRIYQGDQKRAGMDKTDLSTWVAYCSFVLLFAAIVPFAFRSPWLYFTALTIAYANWRIGSYWAIALSEMTIPKYQAVVLAGQYFFGEGSS